MIRLSQQNINTAEHSNKRWNGCLGITDISRFEKLAKYFKGGVYLDMGAWDSVMPVILSERFPKSEINVIDFADEIVQKLGGYFPKVHYRAYDIRSGSNYHIPFNDKSVDYVVAGEIIEHMEDPEAFVKELFRIIKPGGYLAMSTPFEEASRPVGSRIGGDFHIWSFDKQDFNDLLGDPEIELHKEPNNIAMLAWKQKK